MDPDGNTIELKGPVGERALDASEQATQASIRASR
jgi:hypothetical protein